MQNKYGILFDLDGTLIDNEHLKALAFSKAIINLGGVSDSATYKEVMGMDGETIRNHFIRKSNANIDLQEYKELYLSIYQELLENGLTIRAGAREFLEELTEKGLMLALVSSANSVSVNFIVNYFNLDHHFRIIISGEDVIQKKPAPECHLLALDKMELKNNEAIIFEDTEAGLIAANNAGIPAICIQHEYNQSHNLLDATLKFRSFQEDLTQIKEKINSIFKTTLF